MWMWEETAEHHGVSHVRSSPQPDLSAIQAQGWCSGQWEGMHSQSGVCQTGFSALMTHYSLLNATEGSVTDLQPCNVTQTNDAVYESALSTSRMLHSPDKLCLSLPSFTAAASIDKNKAVCIQEWFYSTIFALLKVAVPCHEGPYSACCQRGWVHPEQTASRRCPQTCRVWGNFSIQYVIQSMLSWEVHE